jgi:DNA-binding transcriptional regulator YdaS (Cro superfamily)
MVSGPNPLQALEHATQRAGGQSALARICEVSQPTVCYWIKRLKQMPAEYVLRTEAATGVSRHCLRPDIYPLCATEAAASRRHGADQCTALLVGPLNRCTLRVAFNGIPELKDAAA